MAQHKFLVLSHGKIQYYLAGIIEHIPGFDGKSVDTSLQFRELKTDNALLVAVEIALVKVIENEKLPVIVVQRGDNIVPDARADRIDAR